MATMRNGAGPAQAETPWADLRERVRDAAEGFAKIDPNSAASYRRDAERFCDRFGPDDEDELDALRFEAADLRERWARRFMDRLGRIAR